MGRKRKKFPTAPPAGLLGEIEQAESDRLSSDAIASLLVRLREGDESASEQLISGLRYLVYQTIDRELIGSFSPRVQRAVAKLGALFQGLATAVRRLATNQKTDVEKYVTDQLCRSSRDYKRAMSRNILPAPSTNSMRKRNGLPEYEAIERDTDAKIEKQPDKEQIDMYELLDEFCNTDEERDVCAMLVDGHPIRQIAATLTITKHRVETIIASLRRRAIDKGLEIEDEDAA